MQDVRGPKGELIRIEMFCHGALCMAISGKCYLSLQNAGRSANRGECVQICRRGYEVTDVETGTQLNVDNKYIMSPRDLKTVRFIDIMMNAGVRVFKIEGRARGPEYVYTVVKAYDEAINAVLDGSFTEERQDAWEHEVAVSLSGRAGRWNYMAMFLPGLDSERFGNQSWIHDGSASPFEFKIANNYAFAARAEYTGVRGLRVGVSGYVGNSFRNTLYPTSSEKNDGVRGTVSILSADFRYEGHNWLARGSADWGHLSDAAHISKFNISMSKNSTSKRQEVASDAVAAGIEAGYDFFGLIPGMNRRHQKLYVFGRYDYYDSMARMQGSTPLEWCGRQKISAGINWMPLPQIIVKGDYTCGILARKYNNEPAINLGIAYVGWFKL